MKHHRILGLILAVCILLCCSAACAEGQQAEYRHYENLGGICLLDSPLVEYIDSNIDRCTEIAQRLISVPLETSISIRYFEETDELSFYELFAQNIEFFPVRPSTAEDSVYISTLRNHFLDVKDISVFSSIIVFSDDANIGKCVDFVLETDEGWRLDAFYFPSHEEALEYANGKNCYDNWVFLVFKCR